MDFFTHSICQNYSASQWIFGQNWIFKKSIEIIFGHLEAEFGCTNRTFYITKICCNRLQFLLSKWSNRFLRSRKNAWHGTKLIFLYVAIEFHCEQTNITKFSFLARLFRDKGRYAFAPFTWHQKLSQTAIGEAKHGQNLFLVISDVKFAIWGSTFSRAICIKLYQSNIVHCTIIRMGP